MEDRLLKLEKSNGRLKKYVAFIHIFLVGLAFLGFQNTENVFDKIETNKLILRDSKGIERAVLLIDSNDAVKLIFKDKYEATKVSMGVQEDNKGYFGICDENRYLAYISEGDSSGGYMNFYSMDTSINQNLMIGIDNYDESYLEFWSKENKQIYLSTGKTGGKLLIFPENSTSKHIWLGYTDSLGYLYFRGKIQNELVLGQGTYGGTLYLNTADSSRENYFKIDNYAHGGFEVELKETGFFGTSKSSFIASGLSIYHEGLNMYLGKPSRISDTSSTPTYRMNGTFGLCLFDIDNNKSLFELGTDYEQFSRERGRNFLSFYNNQGNTSSIMYNNGNQSGVGIYDKNEKLRYLTYYNSQTDNISTSLFDWSGNLRLNLGNQDIKKSNGQTFTSSESSFYLFDNNGNVIFEAPQ